MRKTAVMKKGLSLLLGLSLILSCVPTAFAADDTGLCQHHMAHTAECGYAEAVMGSDCTHTHTEDCYRLRQCVSGHTDISECTEASGCITMTLACHHGHDASCGYQAPTEGDPCGHIHDESCGYKAEVLCSCPEILTHEEGCGYDAAVEGQSCACVPAVQHDPETCTYEAEVPCAHTEHTDCGKTDGTAGTPCSHTHSLIVDSAASCYALLCAHTGAGAHDELCGFVAEVSESPCTYECPECEAVETVRGLIEALPDLETLAAMSTEEQSAVYEELLAAEEAYQALNDEQKALLTEENAKLGELLAWFSSLTDPTAGDYTVYIGGTALSVGADGNAAYLKNGGTVGSDTDYNAKLWYDTANAVLKLEMKDLTATGNSAAATPSLQTSTGLYSASPLTLILTGINTVSGVGLKEGNYTNAYGVYLKNDVTISADSDGTLAVTTVDTKGSCYGIYSTGNVTALGGTLNVESGSTVDTTSYTRESYGIYAGGLVTIGGDGLTPFVTAKAGDSYGESCGIFGYNGITINSGTTVAATGYAQKGYADGMLANRATIAVNGGTVNASSTQAYEGMATGICANNLVVSGGEVTATGGSTRLGEQQSAGIYVNYDIDISGGTVTATGREAFGDVSFGMNSWKGNVTISGDSVVYATGGEASYSVGLCVERSKDYGTRAGGDLTIQDNARVYASTVDTNEIRVYSYGIFVGGNLLVQGNPYVQATAGRVGNQGGISFGEKIDREKRSFGIYLGDDIYDSPSSTNYEEGNREKATETHTIRLTGGTVIAKTLDTHNGRITTDEGENPRHRSYAVVIYDAKQIDFSDTTQTNDQWYQWKIQEADAFTRSPNEKYPYADYWQSPTQYFHIEPLSDIVTYTVTYDLNGGTGAEGVDYAAVQVESGTEVTVKATPSRSGYTFTGWSDGTNIHQPGSKITVTGDITLTAQWKEETYTVTYTDGVEDQEVFPDQVYSGLKVGDKTPDFEGGKPERDGYDFIVWTPKVEETVSGTVIYTAQWEKKTYTVTYTDGVDDKEVFPDQVTSGLEVGDKTPDFEGGKPVRDGYEFIGWKPEVAATVNGDATYVAQWEKKITYTVTYTDGVDGEVVFQDEVYEDLIPGVNTPIFKGSLKRKGYIFYGWNPQVAKTVTGNVIYKATWERDRNGNGIADKDEWFGELDDVPKTGDQIITTMGGCAAVIAILAAGAVILSRKKRSC